MKNVVSLFLLLGGCIFPPSEGEVGSASNLTVCLLWSSCSSGDGTSGSTAKEGGATIVPESLPEQLVTPEPEVAE